MEGVAFGSRKSERSSSFRQNAATAGQSRLGRARWPTVVGRGAWRFCWASPLGTRRRRAGRWPQGSAASSMAQPGRQCSSRPDQRPGPAYRAAAAYRPSVVLPLGLPWIGAHFRIDALSAFFLVVVNLGGAAASLYRASAMAATSARRSASCRSSRLPRRHEPRRAGRRRLQLPAAWEFMSLASWALVHGAPPRAGQRARRLRLSGDGEFRHARPAARLRPARPGPTAATPSPRSARTAPRRGVAALVLVPGAARRRARRPVSCRCMSGCRSPIRPRRAMSRR